MPNTEVFNIEDQGNPCKFPTSWFDFPASRQDLAFTRLNHDSNGSRMLPDPFSGRGCSCLRLRLCWCNSDTHP
jgi:hypothetical protein